MRTGIWKGGVALMAAVVAMAVTATSAWALADFATTNGAAYCGTTHGEGPPYLICWTPNDGFTTSMSPRGRPVKRYNPRNKGFRDTVDTMLLFGEWLRLEGTYRCTSRRSGLTCTNRAGHGWWLGRYVGYRLF